MARFESTYWSVIERAKRNSLQAMDELFTKYRAPIVAFARSQGLDDATAEDAAQEVFVALTHEHVLAKADRSKGRFRNLVIKVTRNMIRRMRERAGAQKRGGDRKIVSLDAPVTDGFDLNDAVASRENDRDFDRAWLGNLVDICMARMKKDYEQTGKLHFELLSAFAYGGKTYQEIAGEYGKSEKDVKNTLYLARKKLMDLLHEEIEGYCSTYEEYQEEIKYLAQYMKKE